MSIIRITPFYSLTQTYYIPLVYSLYVSLPYTCNHKNENRNRIVSSIYTCYVPRYISLFSSFSSSSFFPIIQQHINIIPQIAPKINEQIDATYTIFILLFFSTTIQFHASAIFSLSFKNKREVS